MHRMSFPMLQSLIPKSDTGVIDPRFRFESIPASFDKSFDDLVTDLFLPSFSAGAAGSFNKISLSIRSARERGVSLSTSVCADNVMTKHKTTATQDKTRDITDIDIVPIILLQTSRLGVFLLQIVIDQIRLARSPIQRKKRT